MQTVWPVPCVVARRQEEIRRQVAMSRRRAQGPPVRPVGSFRARLGWRLVEVGLRLALPAGAAPALRPLSRVGG